MIKINLISPEYVDKLKQKTKNVQIILLFSIAALIAVAITSLHVNKAYSTEKVLSQKQTELKTFQEKVDKVKEIEKAKKDLAAHLNAIESLLDKRFDYPHFMQDAANSIPKTLRFRNFRTVSDEDGVVEFDITAEVSLGDDMGQWIKNLEEDEKFTNITLGAVGVERDAASKKETYYFPVLGTYFARPKAKLAWENRLKKAKEAEKLKQAANKK
ncbi:MAG TPA: hypothetical protein VMW66_02945 [Elusimicrobiales bacterium]|nr:hypothetical protein [Elusimicrobiales bacterium]